MGDVLHFCDIHKNDFYLLFSNTDNDIRVSLNDILIKLTATVLKVSLPCVEEMCFGI